MDIYITKKNTTDDAFTLAPLDSLPHMHIVTCPVIVKTDANGNLYIATSEDQNAIPNLIKLKKVLLKQQFKEDPDKPRLLDDIIWIKPSPIMYYKKEKIMVPFNKMITGMPLKLQLSCKTMNMYSLDKPYNSYNMYFTVDYVMVDDKFDWNIIGIS
jgi:hypothetical protein